jgi:hypothetical protein
VQAANKRHERRILLNDFRLFRDTVDFTDYFLKTIWGEAGPLEKLITLVSPEDGFTIENIENEFRSNGIKVLPEDLEAAIKMLCYYSVLGRHNKEYHFIPRAFVEILNRTQDVKRLISSEKKRLDGLHNKKSG